MAKSYERKDHGFRPKSYESINYSLRPAKCIERKMLVEAFRLLDRLSPIGNYRYVGFGSPYFADFILIHRALGIKKMVSIERDEENESRFNFNRPFKCVEIQFGDSNDVLPELKWDVPTIIWLDYDGKLNQAVLRDVALFVNSAVPGSMLVVTVNAEPDINRNPHGRDPFKGIGKFRIRELTRDVGEERIPPGTIGHDLSGWSKAKVYRRIILNEINSNLQVVNGGQQRANELLFRQIIHFNYSDSAKMLTLGGLLLAKEQSEAVDQCGFQRLPFFAPDDPCLIETPLLTYRELRYLDTLLPVDADGKLTCDIAIPDSHLGRYQKLYRYFPLFAETEL